MTERSFSDGSNSIITELELIEKEFFNEKAWLPDIQQRLHNEIKRLKALPGKAPLLTDEQIRGAYNRLKMKPPGWIPEIDRMIAKAQLDADHKWYIGGKE